MRTAPVSAPVFSHPYPLVLDLRGRRVLVVGGGAVAARKVAGLVAAAAVVTVVAPDAVPAISDDPVVRWHRRPYRRGEVASDRFAITATDDAEVNRQVARDGEAANVIVNSADDPANCAAILPAVVTRGDLQVAVSTNGRSPAMARWARHHLEALFTDVHARTLDLLSEVRDEARARFGSSELEGWDRVIDDDLFAAVADGRIDDARERVRAALGLAGPLHDRRQPEPDRNPNRILDRRVSS
jgi:precorrin-2 dehydrogenase/sirohydrochlorin ferrochelatase